MSDTGQLEEHASVASQEVEFVELRGEGLMMDEVTKKKVIARLRRIQGQVDGLKRMVEEGRYCIDILLQISAVLGALKQVSFIVLKNHIKTCVSEAITLGSEAERMEKIDELVDVFSKFGGEAYVWKGQGPGVRC